MYTHARTHTHTNSHAHIHVCIKTHVHVYTYMHMTTSNSTPGEYIIRTFFKFLYYTHMYTHIFMDIHTICTSVHVNVHICVHVCMYVGVHVCVFHCQISPMAVTDVRALGIEEDWYKIAQDRKQRLNVHEQICASNYEGGLCAANRPSLAGTFLFPCGRSFGRPGDPTRHQNFCSGIQHQDSGHLDSPNFHCSCGRIFRRKGDLTRHSHFCKAIRPCSSGHYIQGFTPRIPLSSYNGRLQATGVCMCECTCVCACVCVCVSVYVCLCVRTCLCAYMFVCTCLCVSVNMYVIICTCVRAHADTHSHVCTPGLKAGWVNPHSQGSLFSRLSCQAQKSRFVILPNIAVTIQNLCCLQIFNKL